MWYKNKRQKNKRVQEFKYPRCMVNDRGTYVVEYGHKIINRRRVAENQNVSKLKEPEFRFACLTRNLIQTLMYGRRE